MRRQASLFILLLCGIGLAFGLVQLFKLRFEAGDIYPPYSSLRADPLGTMALYESLTELEGLSLERDYRPANELPSGQRTTYLHLGGDRREWQSLPDELEREIERFCGGGGRLVVALSPETSKPTRDWESGDLPEHDGKEIKGRPAPGSIPPSDRSRKKPKHTPNPGQPRARHDRWAFELGFVALEADPEDIYAPSRVANLSSLRLPQELQWHSGTVLTNLGPAWQTIYARGTNPVLAELQLGAGSVVIATDSYFLSNEALVKDRHSDLLVWLIGSGTHVAFDEAHFGIVDQAGIATLIRGYRLQWLAAGLLVLAALYVWKSSATLGPPYLPGVRPDYVAGKDSAGGFVNLLRRNLPKRELLNVCLAEWNRAFVRPGTIAGIKADHARSALTAAKGPGSQERDLVGTYRTLSELLRGPALPPSGPAEPAGSATSVSSNPQ